jgi:hypothetical protein
MKRTSSDFNFYLVYAGISLVDNLTFSNPIKIIHILFLISCDFHPLALSDNLDRRGVDWMHLLRD